MIKKFLHVGCGHNKKEHTTKVFNTDAWEEVRLDINPTVNPDIISSIQDMSSILDSSYDAIFSSHNIEHIFAHEVIDTFKEFRRVLKDGGYLILTCPDIKSVCSVIASGKVNNKLYDSPAGPIYPLDILYGFRQSIASGNEFMVHKYGYTAETMHLIMNEAGFNSFCVAEAEGTYSLWLIAYNNVTISSNKLEENLKKHILFE